MTLKTAYLIIIALFTASINNALQAAKEEEAEKIGNFLLPTSQQPGPLYGFGQNIVDRHDLQFFLYVNEHGSKKTSFTDIIPCFLYGLRDNVSLFVVLPFTPLYKSGCHRSAGIEDMSIQLEWAFYNEMKQKSATQSTLVGNIAFPTGSVTKNPPTGFGATSFFLGFTLSHTAQYWYAWIQGGAQLTTQHKATKIGNQFFYQGGIEGVISARDKRLIAWELELFGQYEQKNKIKGVRDENSGGNIFFIGPSLWVSNEKHTLQLGMAFPAAQHLFGDQIKTRFFLSFFYAYKFN